MINTVTQIRDKITNATQDEIELKGETKSIRGPKRKRKQKENNKSNAK